MNLKNNIRNIKKKMLSNFYVSIFNYIYMDDKARRVYRSGNIETNSGTIHQKMSLEESTRYIYDVFNDYKYYSSLDRFHGKIAEVGPGDNCGVALLFLEDGCGSVDLVDRFYSKRNIEQQADIYRYLANQHDRIKTLLANADVMDEFTFSGVNRCYGSEASAEEFFLGKHGFDYVISRAVFEHLYDPLLALERIALSLNHKGMMLHKIDLRDHALFSEKFHELKFLEIPECFYRRMTRFTGFPNRVLVNQYRECLERTGLDYRLLVTRLAGVGEITPHLPYENISAALRRDSLEFVLSKRSRFAAKFRNVSDEDLSVSGIFIVAQRIE